MSRIGLTIKSTELRPGEVMTTEARGLWLWSPSEARGWYVSVVADGNIPDEAGAWEIRHERPFSGTIIAVDVPADAEALARVCRGEPAFTSGGVECATDDHPPASDAGAGAVALSDDALISALRAHPDPLGLLARAKIARAWDGPDNGGTRVRFGIATETAWATGPETAEQIDARLLADGWRLL